jgi:hypothetical protein
VADYPESSLKLRREQRKYFRFPVEGKAMLFLREPGAGHLCRMMDLGLEGCRLHPEGGLTAVTGAQVEVSFRLGGSSFRFAGTLQWSAKGQSLGIKFQKMSDHRKQELAELLGGLREELEARAEAPQAQQPSAAPKSALAQSASTAPVTGPVTVPGASPASTASPSPVAAAERKQDRREHQRHTVDSHARILILSLHTKITGMVLDVSMSGCRIRAHDRIPVGIYRRVEVEFMLDGMPLLLPGVTQTLHDPYSVGIRFVEMTERKRGLLQAVIDELERRHAGEAEPTSV